jgi:hypothetical protein
MIEAVLMKLSFCSLMERPTQAPQPLGVEKLQ